MDIEFACNLLDIPYNNLTNISEAYIKKKYYLCALKYHPDKNNNTEEATLHFQQISEAYQYLISLDGLLKTDLEKENGKEKEKERENGKEKERENGKDFNYINIFINFLNINKKYKDLLFTTIYDILLGVEDMSFQILQNLNRDTLLEIYQVLHQYKQILNINKKKLDKIKDILLEKYNNNSIYILNPSIKDILENNLYKLVIEENNYLVPLWHNELYFDSPNGEMIVICNPELDENIEIDEFNNIIIDVNFAMDRLFIDKYITYVLGNAVFEIPIDKLFIKKKQYYIFYNQGISKIIENDMYNTENKSHIIFKISIL